eukprot:scaffold184_cov316-Pinguiococcus_pyrenoidosus.AAC.32
MKRSLAVTEERQSLEDIREKASHRLETCGEALQESLVFMQNLGSAIRSVTRRIATEQPAAAGTSIGTSPAAAEEQPRPRLVGTTFPTNVCDEASLIRYDLEDAVQGLSRTMSEAMSRVQVGRPLFSALSAAAPAT